MKSLNIHTFVLLACTLLCAKNSFAQKEGNVQQLKELPKSVAHITPEIESQIIAIVKPVKDKIEQLFKEDATGTYAAYAAEMEKISKVTNLKDKFAQLQQFQKKYYPFVKDTWAKAKINDADYQLKIKAVFPAKARETISFGDFLNFSMGGSYQKPAPPPPPPPAPTNICVNANSFFRGTFGMDGSVIGGTRVQVVPARPPSPAEIVAGSDAAILGFYRSQGWIRNTIAIPGQFPSDGKSLRATKSFNWTGMGTAFTILGCSWSTVAYTTNPDSDDFSIGGEIYSVVSPVTFIQMITKRTSKTEESVLSKTDINGIWFGITCYTSASSSIFLSYAHSNSSCGLTRWDICEQ
jgi:hypothetical protein